MKNKTKIKILIAFILMTFSGNAQNVFIDKKPTNEIAALEFPKFSKSIVFFGEKNATEE